MEPLTDGARKLTRREYMKRWSIENRDRVRERRREWRSKNRAKVLAYRRGWIEKNADTQREKISEYLQRTKQRRSISQKAYRESNKAAQLVRVRTYRKLHPEKFRMYSTVRRAKFPWGAMIRSARGGAKKRGIEFVLTNEWAKQRWTGLCELSGLPMTHGIKTQHIFSPSIDRIDNSLGYIPSNCRFICLGLNMMKGTSTDAEMFALMRAALALADEAKRHGLATGNFP